MSLEDIRAIGGKSGLPSTIATYQQEKSMRFPGGWIVARCFTWNGAQADWTADDSAYLFNLALTPRIPSGRMAYLDAGRDGAPQRTGRALVIPPGQTIRTSATLSRQRTFDCLLDVALIEDVLGRRPQWEPPLLRETMRLNWEAEWLLLRMYRELSSESFAGPVLVEGLANALAVTVIRQFALERRRSGSRRGGLAPWRMHIVRERIEAEGPAPTLSELAELCGVSVRHLSRAFKAETGNSIGKAIQNAVLERAAKLLAERSVPIGEIARTLGFADSASFAYAFRRATGLRPSEVRARRRAGLAS
jgi:AraC family transcriptional regulator